MNGARELLMGMETPPLDVINPTLRKNAKNGASEINSAIEYRTKA
jgi:hypothetical protein